MHDLLAAIEQAAIPVWMREDPYAYFVALILHAFGMALLAGGGIVIGLRALGLAAAAPLERFRGFLPLMGLGAILAIVSGLLLLCAYPAKALTNPVFAIKLACLLGASLLARRLVAHPMPRQRLLAALMLVLWFGGIAAGKLLLHTWTVLMVS